MGNLVSGADQVVVGSGNKNSGVNSFVLGYDNTNAWSGTDANVFGRGNYSNANRASIYGSGNLVSGNDSAIYGYNNTGTVTATRSHVFGLGNVVSGANNITIGSGNSHSGFDSIVVGYGNINTLTGVSNNVFGRGNTSHATGLSIFGSGNHISGAYSATYGYGNRVSLSSTRTSTFGLENTSLSRNQTILGSGNINSGIDSYIIGYGNQQETGTFNAIFGSNNIVKAGLTGVGIYGNEITLPLSGNAGYKLNPNNMNGAIQVGANNSGKITILYNGNIGIGTSGTLPFENPQELIHLRSGNALFDATEGGYLKFYDKYQYDNTPDNPSQRDQPGDIRAIVSGGNFKIDGDLILSTGIGETGQFLAGRIFQEATVRNLDGTMWCYSVSDIFNNCAQPQTIKTGDVVILDAGQATTVLGQLFSPYYFNGLSGIEILPNSFLRLATRGDYGGYYAQWESSSDGINYSTFPLFLHGTTSSYLNTQALGTLNDFTGLFPNNAKFLRVIQPAGNGGGGSIRINITGQIGAAFYNTTYANNTEIITGTDGIAYTHKTQLWQPTGLDLGWDTFGSATLNYASGYNNGYAQTISIKEGAIAQPDFCNIDCNYDYQPHEYGRLSGIATQFLDGNPTSAIISGRYTFLNVPIMKTTNVYLPSAYQNSGALYTIKNLGKGNIMVFPSGIDKIDLYFTGFMIDQRFASYEFLSNGSGWFLV